MCKMKNEFGEIISENKIEKIAKRIQKLSFDEIDTLFYKCGWVNTKKEKENKALEKDEISEIKKNSDIALAKTKNLLIETSIKEVLKNLNAVENLSRLRID